MFEQKFEQQQEPVEYELPSAELLCRKIVPARDIFVSETWRESNAEIPIALGKNDADTPVIFDLAKAPQVLIAGSVESGKSMCINTLMLSLLFHFKPDELKMILFDPLLCEFECFEHLPHLLVPVIHDVEPMIAALHRIAVEMEKRYQILAENEAKTLSAYNRQHQGEKNGCYGHYHQ